MVKKTIWIDDSCVGTSIPKVFFYKEVEANKEFLIRTQSEFDPNVIKIHLENGKNYYFKQYLVYGWMSSGADLIQVSESEGQKAISKLKLAKSG